MIQAGGYGQILGTGGVGGGNAGGTIYGAAASNVSFARWVQIEKLNLERRRLRQQEAQAEATRDLNDRNFDLQSQKYNLEVRRLEMAEQQRLENAARTEQIYNDKLAQAEYKRQRQEANDAWQQDYREQQLEAQQAKTQAEYGEKAAKSQLEIIKAGGVPLDSEGNRLESNGFVPYTDGSGQQYMVPVGKNGAAAGGGKLSDADKLLYKSRNAELSSLEKEITDDSKELNKLEEELAKAEESAATAAPGDKEERTNIYNEKQGKYAKAQRDVEAKREKLEAYRAYQQGSVADPSLESDVGWMKWKELPWSGRNAYTPSQRSFVINLLDSKDEQDRNLLRAVVAKGKDGFDLDAATAYQAGKDGKAAEAIPAATWMAVDWNTKAGDETVAKRNMIALMRKDDITPGQLNALIKGVNAMLPDEYKGFRIPVTSQPADEGKAKGNGVIAKYEIDTGANGQGLVIYDGAGGKRQLLTLEQWNAMSDEAKEGVQEKLNQMLRR